MPAVPGSGRKHSLEWGSVVGVEGSSKVKCKYCQIELSSKIERIKFHLQKSPSNKDKEITQISTLEGNVSSIQRSTSSASQISISSTSDSEVQVLYISDNSQMSQPPMKKVKTRTQQHIDDFAIKTTDKQKNALDHQIAKFFLQQCDSIQCSKQ